MRKPPPAITAPRGHDPSGSMRGLRRIVSVSALALQLLACGSKGPIFLEAPSETKAAWVLALHRNGGALDVEVRLDWSAPVLVDPSETRAIEVLGYDDLSLPVGRLPAFDAPGMRPEALPKAAVAYVATTDDSEVTRFEPAMNASAALLKYRYGIPTSCLSLRTTTFELPTTGEVSATWLDSESALISAGDTHYRLTRNGFEAFSPCGVSDNYSSIRDLGDGTFVVAGIAPVNTAVVRFDLEAMSCSVVRSMAAPSERPVLFDRNESGVRQATAYAITSSGSIFRFVDAAGWELAHEPVPDFVFASDFDLIQLAGEELVAFANKPEIVIYGPERGRDIRKVPETPVPEPDRHVESIAHVPEIGVVVSTGDNELFATQPESSQWQRLASLAVDVKTVVRLGRGAFVIPKEGTTRQLYPEEACGDEALLDDSPVVLALGSDERVLVVHRPEDERQVRWLTAQ